MIVLQAKDDKCQKKKEERVSGTLDGVEDVPKHNETALAQVNYCWGLCFQVDDWLQMIWLRPGSKHNVTSWAQVGLLLKQISLGPVCRSCCFKCPQAFCVWSVLGIAQVWFNPNALSLGAVRSLHCCRVLMLALNARCLREASLHQVGTSS